MSDTTLSPLAEIEQSVQSRAKDRNVDVAGGDGIGILRDLIDDEIATWSQQFKRGLRPYDLSDPDLVADRAFRNLAGYGPLAPLLGRAACDEDDRASGQGPARCSSTGSAGRRSAGPTGPPTVPSPLSRPARGSAVG